MDIGNRIRDARKQANMTQEDAAEALCVSRQTISNWENEKTWPDIVSVVRMSDLYHVTLDFLLKGEQTMSKDYVTYLEESTNTVKSHRKLGKIILVASALVIWAIAMIVFWCIISPSDALGYSFMFLWLILPLTIFTVSLITGLHDYWGKFKWLAVPIFGILYMLSEFMTFSMANMVSFGTENILIMSNFLSYVWMILAGAAVSAAGLGLGTLIRWRKGRTRS